MNKKKILIVFLSGLGNVILFRPILKVLKEITPDSEIDMLVEHKVVQNILEHEHLVNTFYFWENSAIKKLKLLLLIRRSKYNVFITTFDEQGWKLAVFSFLTGIKLTVGYRKNQWYDRLFKALLPIDVNKHEIERHLEILKIFRPTSNPTDDGISQIDFSLNIPFGQYTHLDPYLNKGRNPIICIHAGSSEALANKRWNLENFIKLSENIYSCYNTRIIFIGGTNESYLTEQIKSSIKCPAIVLIGKLNLWETAYLLRNANVLVSNDTGLMHLASALNVPVVAIFGPMSRIKNSPLGKRSFVVSSDMECSPCDLHIKCDKNMQCLRSISIESVMDKIDMILSSPAGIQ